MKTIFDSTFNELKAAQFSSGAETRLKDNNTMLCYILIKIPGEKHKSLTLLRLCNVLNISDSTCKSWVDCMKQFVESRTEYQCCKK